MTAYDLPAFLAYWQREGERYSRHGDYAWMAGLVSGERVLEIGCGAGFGTVALAARGVEVLALDLLAPCIALTAERTAGTGSVRLLQADLTTLDEEAINAINAFRPDAVVCWLMGAPEEVSGVPANRGGAGVAAYRERLHRLVATLACDWPGVRQIHFVDRTAIAWQAKDIGREALVRYHLATTLKDLPFSAVVRNACYRKLDATAAELAQLQRLFPGARGVVPVLASMIVERKT